MKRRIRKREITSFVAILLTVIAIVSYLDQAKIISHKGTQLFWLTLIIVVSICVFIIDKKVNFFKKNESISDDDISEAITLHSSIDKSLDVKSKDEKDIDNTYINFVRQDMLNFDSGRYYSLRRITGRNISKHLGEYVVQTETIDNAAMYNQIEIIARDYQTNEILNVIPISDKKSKSIKHTFRIEFLNPIEKGESFDIIYSIEIKNASITNPQKEVTSIALNRYDNVDELIFNVCLNFKPSKFTIKGRNHDDLERYYTIKHHNNIEPYTVTNDFERRFITKWLDYDTYIIKYKLTDIKYDQYIIYFEKGE